MKDRFDLEHDINTLYNFCDHLNDICEGILEQGLEKDDIVNALMGLKVLLGIHTCKLNDTMIECFKLNQHSEKSHFEPI